MMEENELPKGWEWKTVDEVVSEVKDRVNPELIEVTNYIGLENLKSGGGIQEVNLSSAVKSQKTKFRIGDVLYGKLRPYLSKHAITEINGICSTDILAYRSSNPTTAKLFHYYITQRSFVIWANENSKGVNLPRISSKVINKHPFPLPPLPVQKRIVSKLDVLFGHLEVLKEKLAGILNKKEYFVKSCLINNQNKKYYPRVLLRDFIEERKEKIGSEWEGLRLIGVSAKKGIINLSVGQKKSFEKYKIVQPGDFVYNTMRVNIGSVAIYDGSKNALTSPDYVVFRVTNYFSKQLVLNYLKSDIGIREINNNTKGSVRARLYFKSLINIRIPKSSIEQQEIAEMFLGLLSKVQDTYDTKLNLTFNNLEQSILTKAFKGELTT